MAKEALIKIKVDDSGIRDAQRKLKKLDGEDVAVNVNVNDGDISDAKTDIDSLNQDVTVNVNVNDGDLADAKTVLDGIEGTEVNTKLNVNGIDEVKSSFAKIQDSAAMTGDEVDGMNEGMTAMDSILTGGIAGGMAVLGTAWAKVKSLIGKTFSSFRQITSELRKETKELFKQQRLYNSLSKSADDLAKKNKSRTGTQLDLFRQVEAATRATAKTHERDAKALDKQVAKQKELLKLAGLKLLKYGAIGSALAAVAVSMAAIKSFFDDTVEGQRIWRRFSEENALAWAKIRDAVGDTYVKLTETDALMAKGGDGFFAKLYKGVFKTALYQLTGGLVGLYTAYVKLKKLVIGEEDMKKINNYSRDRNNIIDWENKLLVENAERRKQISALLLDSREEEKYSAAQRLQYISMAEEKQKEVYNQEHDLLVAKIKLMENEMALTASSEEEERALAELKAQLFDKEASHNARMRDLANRRLTIEKQITAENKKRTTGGGETGEETVDRGANPKGVSVLKPKGVVGPDALPGVIPTTPIEPTLVVYEAFYEQLATWYDMDLERLYESEEQKAEIRRRFAEDAAYSSSYLFGALADIMEQGSKKQFESAKLLRYGEAALSMYAGISNALATGQPYVRWIDAAAVAASGVAQMVRINQMEYGDTSAGSAGGTGIATPSVSNTAPVTSGRALYEYNQQAEPLRAFVVHSDLEAKNREAVNTQGSIAM